MREDWVSLKLKEVCEIRPPKRETKEILDEEDLVSFVPMSHLNEERKDFNEEEAKPLKSVYKGYTYFKDGDVLLAKITPCFENGKMGIANGLSNGVGFGSSEFIVYRPDSRLIAEYLFYFLLSPKFRSKGEKMMGGAVGHQRIPKEFYEDYEIPIPPLPEQKRIVAILEEAFEAIDKAIVNVERNIKNAEELFQSKLNEIFSQRGEGWEETPLGELGTITSSKRIYKKEYVEEGVPFYRSKEIKELGNGNEITTELFISENRYLEIKNKFGTPSIGDVLLTAVGTIGEMYVVDSDEEFYFKDGNIMWLKNFDSLNPYYLKFALLNFVEQLQSISQGSAYKALTIEKTKKYSIPVPPIEKQQLIVRQLEEFNNLSDAISESNKAKLLTIEELKKSILQKAFSGELTANETVPA